MGFSKSQTSLVLISLILISSTLQTISVLEGKDTIPESFVLPNGKVLFQLENYVNFSKIKYPLTFNIKADESPAKQLNYGFSYRDSFVQLSESERLIKSIGDIAWTQAITKNLVIIVPVEGDKVIFREVHGKVEYKGQFTELTLTDFQGFACEDLSFDDTKEATLLFCRNKTTKKIKIYVIIQSPGEFKFQIIAQKTLDYSVGDF
jgi:hypothetical protein